MAAAFGSMSSRAMSSGSGTINQPAGYAAGDVVYGWFSGDNAGATISGLTGFSELASSGFGSDGQCARLYRRVYDGTEPSSYSITETGSADGVLVLIRVTDAHGTTPEDVTLNGLNIGSAGASPLAIDATGLTTVTNGCLLLWFGAIDITASQIATYGAPSGFTLRASEPSGGSWSSVGVASQVQASAGATGTISGTATFSSGTATPIGILVAVRPSSAGVDATANGTTSAHSSSLVAGSASGETPGIHRPSSDVSTAGWTAVPSGALYEAVNELGYDEADFVVSPVAGASPLVFGIEAIPAGSYTVHIGAATTSGTATMRAKLLDSGGSVLGTSADQAIDSTPTTYELNITISATASRVRLEVEP